jgi:ribosomal protein S18 acetylase RimI-like enzyme
MMTDSTPGSTANAVALVPFTTTSPHLEGVISLFVATWAADPHLARTSDEAERQLREHAALPGYKGVAALSSDGSVVGFAYGMIALSAPWWHEHVARELGPERAARELSGAFAFAELAVAPTWRRRGLGQRLHDVLLAGLPHERAVLSTECDNAPALALYARAGWQPMVPRMRFDAAGPDFTILGLALR